MKGSVKSMRDKEDFLSHISGGDNGKEAKEFYKKYFTLYDKNTYSGDALFTPIALLDGLHPLPIKRGNNDTYQLNQVRTLFKDGEKEKDLIKAHDIKEALIRQVSQKLNPHKNIFNDYWCLANLGVLRCKTRLNPWRGAYRRLRLGDFPDLFFKCIKMYLTNAEPAKAGNGYSNIEFCKLNACKWWFQEIGCKKKDDGTWDDEAWEIFVKEMMLKGSFVDEHLNVERLFCHEIGKPFPDLSSILKDKPYTTEQLVERLSEVPEIKKCISNIYTIWCKRAAYLAETGPICSRHPVAH